MCIVETTDTFSDRTFAQTTIWAIFAARKTNRRAISITGERRKTKEG